MEGGIQAGSRKRSVRPKSFANPVPTLSFLASRFLLPAKGGSNRSFRAGRDFAPGLRRAGVDAQRAITYRMGSPTRKSVQEMHGSGHEVGHLTPFEQLGDSQKRRSGSPRGKAFTFRARH